MNRKPGLIGRKVGMTQYFNEAGEVVPVTVVEAGPNVVLQVKTINGRDGYNAIQVGFSEQKAHRINKPEAGHFAKAGAAPQRIVRELRLDNASAYKAGQTITVGEVFNVGDKVDVVGTSRGRGFSGVMRRHNFKGFIRTHGTHEFFRHGGSIGTRLTPGHVAKGRKMPGQMGNKQVTLMNLTVAKVDAEANLLFIKGGIPGPSGGFVMVRASNKKSKSRAK